jgi:hypothetical protein
MPHTYAFNPPVRGNWRGPLLKIQLKDPLLEKTLSLGKIEGPGTPYRKSADVENLLDDLTFRRSASGQDGLLLISLALVHGVLPPGSTAFDIEHGHIHNTNQPMYPDVLLGHSAREEGGRIVKIAVEDELGILAVSLLRELGYPTYLSAVETPAGTTISGFVILKDDEIRSMVIRKSHPYVSKLMIFDDGDAVNVLRLLHARNGLRRLFEEMKDRSMRSADEERYRFLMGEFALGAASAHHLVRPVEEIFVAFAERFPELLRPKEALS